MGKKSSKIQDIIFFCIVFIFLFGVGHYVLNAYSIGVQALAVGAIVLFLSFGRHLLVQRFCKPKK